MAIQKDDIITADDVNTALNGKADKTNTYTKSETDSKFMPKTGGTFTGNVSMGNYILTVPTPPLP
jgi:hypothetical protein